MDTETFTTTRQVPEHNLPKLHEGIEKINKRCRRLGVSEITVLEGAEEFKDVEIIVDHVEDEHGKRAVYATRTIRFVTVTISGQAPRINGWTFAATITDLEGINMLSSVPGLDRNIPDHYRTAASKCDHCGYERNRKETFVLFGQDRWVQVGRTCLKDFLGYNDPHKVADYCALLGSLDALCDECGDYSGSEGRSEPWFTLYSETNPIYSYLAISALCIRLYGWLSRTKARELDKMESATSVIAMNIMNPGKSEEDKAEARKVLVQMTDEDKELAQKSLEWAQSLNPAVSEDYLHNVRTLAIKGMTNHRFSGIAASIVPAYLRAMGLDVNRKQKRESHYFGTTGKREVFTLTLTAKITIEGNYGITLLHKFEDVDGNVAIWFASGGESGRAMSIGSTYTVKATVKDHNIRNNVRQTQLSRVALYTPPAPKAKRTKKTQERTITKPATCPHCGAASDLLGQAGAPGIYFCVGCQTIVRSPELDQVAQ